MKLLPLAPGQKRADCPDARPCPFSCRHRLDKGGACVLDIVEERGPMSLNEIGEFFDVTRERIRQIETKAIAALKKRGNFER